MADDGKSVQGREDADIAVLPRCGVIMPISPTENFGEQHWADVQKLLHRAIDAAGFAPVNVWVNDVTDRVSERIVGNIYAHDVVVADISDLNPNVMLELGLRLASKKPTIVIVNDGGTIPFDIRDFHALHYPGDLNILGMELFFEKIATSLQQKYQAFKSDNYTPFLGQVVVDVLAPTTQEVGMSQLLLSRLDDIGVRLGRLEASGNPRSLADEVRQQVRWQSNVGRNINALTNRITAWPPDAVVYLEFPTATEDQLNSLANFIASRPGMVATSHQTRGKNGLRVNLLEPMQEDHFLSMLQKFLPTIGLKIGDLTFTVSLS